MTQALEYHPVEPTHRGALRAALTEGHPRHGEHGQKHQPGHDDYLAPERQVAEFALGCRLLGHGLGLVRRRRARHDRKRQQAKAQSDNAKITRVNHARCYSKKCRGPETIVAVLNKI